MNYSEKFLIYQVIINQATISHAASYSTAVMVKEAT